VAPRLENDENPGLRLYDVVINHEIVPISDSTIFKR
jgi:hypothetical protein